MHFEGYYRYPTIWKDKIAFIAEDDLWLVGVEGGIAKRLTSNIGEVSHPFFSPDGKFLAFVGREEGNPEVYVMPSDGGEAERLTYLGGSVIVLGWEDKDHIIFASNHEQPFRSLYFLYKIHREGGLPEKLPYGPARSISIGKDGVVIGRNTGDPARWKRYRGGTAGELWIKVGKSKFRKLIELKGNLASPMWIGDRIYFISDHENVGNIYSCLPDGSDLKKHTNHRDFYVRNASSDGRKIVYHAGADIYVFDTQTEKDQRVPIEYKSPLIQRKRKFVNPLKYLERFSISEDAAYINVITRGKSFTMGLWDGPVTQHGIKHGVRYFISAWLNDAKRLVVVSDEGNKEHLEIHSTDGKILKKFTRLDVGRPYTIKVSPDKENDIIALRNHREELVLVDLKKGKEKIIDRAKQGSINGFNFSPCGRYIAYGVHTSIYHSIIRIYDTKTDKIHDISEPMMDYSPAFSDDGKYLFFLSKRIYNPVSDGIHFALGFPRGSRPYVVSLKKDVRSPFLKDPQGFSEKKPEGNEKKEEKKQSIEIDFEGIERRIVPLPVPERLYFELDTAHNRIFYTALDDGESLLEDIFESYHNGKDLYFFDLNTEEEELFFKGVSSFKISMNKNAIGIRTGDGIRVISTQGKPDTKEQKPGRKSGIIDISRIKLEINPPLEWEQMFKEAWRLQREYFWREDMSGIHWENVLKKYLPLIKRVATRAEFSDLIWEMQGELGTSHAYEMGGDYKPRPHYNIGFLGADIEYDKRRKAFYVKRILKGDGWHDRYFVPLAQPGVEVEEGMIIDKIDNDTVDYNNPPHKLLVNRANDLVKITFKKGRRKKEFWIKTIDDEEPVRYRDWVERNREYVHQKTNNKVGYVHIPDMGARGFSEFFRYYLSEFDYDGLIIDVRFNGGGFVSQLILEKIALKRIGYDFSRWMGKMPYPIEARKGPLVAITNEYAGSDGDIFSHAFKLLKLGKLIGRRTWGGVVGIWPRNWLVDGTVTTQPEFSFWFQDVGWGVENYGTEPDIEVDITPEEYTRGKDPQLDMAIKIILKEIKKNPPLEPKMRA